MKTKRLKFMLPVLVLAVAALGADRLMKAKRPPETRAVEYHAPLVRVIPVESSDVRFTVRGHGTVAPRAEGALVSEVSGKVAEISPSLVNGGFFEEGEVLIALDDADFKLAVVRAGARVAQAQARLEREEAEAEVARKEWERLGEGEPGALVLREPQMAETRAALAAAKADLEQAERDLARTSIRAPYAGRVLGKSVELGEFAARGNPLARIYAIDYAEVRIPVPDDQLAYLDLPLYRRQDDAGGPGPEARLRVRFAGKEHEWTGRIVRTEGEIDPRSRMVTAVARVDDPYGRSGGSDRPPLAVGLFVDVEIIGRIERGVFELPRSALRNHDTIYVVDEGGRIRFRTVEVSRAGVETVVVKSGLQPGEKVCLSALEEATDGMKVREYGGEETGASPAGPGEDDR